MITDHVWRPLPDNTPNMRAAYPDVNDYPCGYMNCRKPKNAHKKAARR